MTFSSEEMSAARRLVELALAEDQVASDITSQALIPAELKARTSFVARSDGVLAGLPAVALVCAEVNQALQFEPLMKDGTPVSRGTRVANLSGPTRAILAAERTALNFLQHLSGIATLTHQYIERVAGLPCRILDTRKTIPGWRLLAKYAVRCGGGVNHRFGLHDGILIKDNHLAALHQGLEAVTDAVKAALAHGRKEVWVEVEVDKLDQLERALAAHPNMILLDNMSVADLMRAVALRNERVPGILLEASGGVNLQTVRSIAETGVDRISVGALTHSAPALDIALDYTS
jgi:nicotinate-nucleotide pyrophosphorylase (carboxylating)